MYDCEICGIGPGCLCTLRECPDYYFPASKEQVIDRLANGLYKNHRDNMKKYLKDAFGVTFLEYAELPGDVDETCLADI